MATQGVGPIRVAALWECMSVDSWLRPSSQCWNWVQSSNGLGVMAVKSSLKKRPKIGVQEVFFLNVQPHHQL